MDYRLFYLRLLNLKNKMEQTEKALLGKHGLTRNDTLIISALGVSELTLSEISKLCCLDKSTVTKIVKKLETDNYIKKQTDKLRGYTVCLTEKGIKLNENTFSAFKILNDSANEFLSEEEIHTVNSLLNKFLQVSEDEIYAGIIQRLEDAKGE